MSVKTPSMVPHRDTINFQLHSSQRTFTLTNVSWTCLIGYQEDIDNKLYMTGYKKYSWIIDHTGPWVLHLTKDDEKETLTIATIFGDDENIELSISEWMELKDCMVEANASFNLEMDYRTTMYALAELMREKITEMVPKKCAYCIGTRKHLMDKYPCIMKRHQLELECFDQVLSE